jgi:hypothetical protein
MGRGFDVYRFTPGCEGPTCVVTPNTPGKATGGGQVEGELADLSILEGTSAGGRANFAFNAQFENGSLSGHLTFNDRGAKKKVESTSLTSFTQAGNTATFTGLAKVNGVAGFAFTVKVEDGGELAGADTFSLVVSDAYIASGVLLKGNIQVHD